MKHAIRYSHGSVTRSPKAEPREAVAAGGSLTTCGRSKERDVDPSAVRRPLFIVRGTPVCSHNPSAWSNSLTPRISTMKTSDARYTAGGSRRISPRP